uniref:Small integral membrane protein 14 n=1 Tax=Timema cristinae TaxID=61476 RepID=A0A7R9H6T1_TIMCR|nr:unnamed protein product [Timema cristinae]
MSDDGFDPCECTWSHEMAMRRLLSLNFSSVVKKWWVDTKGLVEAMAPAGIGLGTPWFEHHWCIKSKVPDLIPMLMIPGSLPGSQNESNGFMMMAMCWVALALAIFFLRPNTLRAIDDSKPRNNGPWQIGTRRQAVDKHAISVALLLVLYGIQTLRWGASELYPHFHEGSVENNFGEKKNLFPPNQDSNLDLPIISSLVHCESSVLGHPATGAGPKRGSPYTSTGNKLNEMTVDTSRL